MAFWLTSAPPTALAQREGASFPVGQRKGGLVASVALSPDGKTVAALVMGNGNEAERDDTIRLWDVRTRKELARLRPAPGRRGLRLAFTPDGKSLVAPLAGRVDVWDVGKKALRSTFGVPGGAEYAAVAPDGRSVACGLDTVTVYDVATGKLAATLASPARVHERSISADGRWLAGSHNGGRVSVWDLKAGKLAGTFRVPDANGYCGCLALSPDGKRLAASCDHLNVFLWDRAGRKLVKTLRFSDHQAALSPWGLFWAPDGKSVVLAGSGRGRGIYAWWPDKNLLRDTSELRRERHTTAALSKDGKLLATGHHAVQVWELPPLHEP